MKKNYGFTLLELLITVAIVGILMAFGLPAMDSYVKNDRLSTQINALVGHLAYARSEAVLRSQQVILCASSDMTSCSAGGNWADGWIIFIDADNSSTFTGTEEILRVKQTLIGGNTLTSTTGSSIIYDNRGFSPNSNGSFSLCDDRGATYMKSISISNTGRVRQGGAAAC
jgi:type IV fimbrial biogenesis protein FimT